MDIIGIVYSQSVPVAKESVTNIPIIGVIGRFLQVCLFLFWLDDLTLGYCPKRYLEITFGKLNHDL